MFVRKITKIILIVLIAIAFIIAVSLVVRLAYRAFQRDKHKIQAPGIDSMETVEIGGVNQSIYIRGKDLNNPVILFLHGGPGFPIMYDLQDFQYDWEDKFTVVQWDQRNVGKSYFANEKSEINPILDFDTSVEDAWEVTQYLMDRLNKEKIIVMGHSWGTVLGTALVQSHPEAYQAYIGTGQTVNMQDALKLGYEKTLAQAETTGDDKDMEELKKLKDYWDIPYGVDFQNKYIEMQKFYIKYKLDNGIDFNMLLTMFFSPYYTLQEISYLMKDNTMLHQESLRYLVNDFDIHNYGYEYSMPVYYIMGENDINTPLTLAETFFSQIQAPKKQFFYVPNAAHNAMIENKDEFTRILNEEILKSLNE